MPRKRLFLAPMSQPLHLLLKHCCMFKVKEAFAPKHSDPHTCREGMLLPQPGQAQAEEHGNCWWVKAQ